MDNSMKKRMPGKRPVSIFFMSPEKQENMGQAQFDFGNI